MTASKRTALLRQVRNSLEREALRAGDTPEQAAAYATLELRGFQKPVIGKPLFSNRVLRAVARES